MTQGTFPPIIYGTAWKRASTARLTALALSEGFRGIDTAGQPKHYEEKLCGDGIAQFIHAQTAVQRKDIFIQSKFTLSNGQDCSNMPYNPQDPPAVQVATSVRASLRNLRTDYLDSYLLHGPYSSEGLQEIDWQVWRELEKLVGKGTARHIGICNVKIEQLEELYANATVKPTFVQNRCYASDLWDRRVRHFCTEKGIVYQGFSLLTANSAMLRHPSVESVARRCKISQTGVIFKFARQIGMLPLSGTCDSVHMGIDIDAIYNPEYHLSEEEMTAIEDAGVRGCYNYT